MFKCLLRATYPSQRLLFQIVLLIGGALFFNQAQGQGEVEVTLFSLQSLRPLPNYPLILENIELNQQWPASTNEQGQVRFSGLTTSGSYRVKTAQSDTLLPSESSVFQLRSNSTRAVTVLIPSLNSLELQEVAISGSSTTRINTINAEVSSEMPRKQIEELPVEGRDITRMLYRLPNVSQATGFFPEAPNVSINGANGLFNNYMIDGLDNNDQFLGGQRFAMPVGFVENVTVLTNNYSVEFGNTGNGIINLTTRSGTNAASGEAFFITRPGAVLDAESPFAQRDLSGNPVKDGFQRYQGGFAVGGAVLPDKTFFYVNAEHTTDLKDNLLNVPQLGVNSTVRGRNTFNFMSAKIDHIWSSRWRSSLRANFGRVSIERQGGGLDGGIAFPQAGTVQQRNSFNLAATTGYTGKNFASQTQLQLATYTWDYLQPLRGAEYSVELRDESNVPFAQTGGPNGTFLSEQTSLQARQRFTWYLNKHTVKVGAEMLSTDHLLTGGGNPLGSYVVVLSNDQIAQLAAQSPGAGLQAADLPSDVRVTGYSVELQPSAFGTRQTISSFYVEDQFSASARLNLTLGLRYDYDNLSRGGGADGDYNNVAPRFSFNYKLTDRSALRGGAGLFYDKILYAIYSDALQQNATNAGFQRQIQELIDQGLLPADTDLDAVTFNGNQSAGFVNPEGLDFPLGEGATAGSFPSQNVFSNERRILNPGGYQNPYTAQFSLGYQYQVSENVLFYADAVYNESYNLFRTTNLNAAAPWDYAESDENGIARSAAWADETRPVPITTINGQTGGLINGEFIPGVARNVVMTETAGRSRYRALTMNLQKERGEDKFSYRFIYTLSRLENNTEDINFRAMDANRFENEWGPSINDRTHIINAIYSWYPFKNLILTGAALLQSGQPVNRIPNGLNYVAVNSDGTLVTDVQGNAITTNDLNGDGAAFGDAYVGNSDRHPGEGRNSDRLPWSNTFDFSAQYQFELGGATPKSRIEIRADVFNIFNAENWSGYSNNATQSNQIQTGSAASGTFVQRNASPPRQFQFGLRYVF